MTDSELELRIAWERHVGRAAPASRWYQSVVRRYREPQRRYHDVRHLRWVVRHVVELASDRRLDDLGATTVAAFFHDAIYDPAAADNEAARARFAVDALRELDWPAARTDRVATMILGTSDHRLSETSTTDDAVLFAADLGVLAAAPAGYSDYVRNVRREYGHVSEIAWVTGRSAVLRSFLRRDAIYAPELGLHDWEARARGNLTAELDALGADVTDA
jgi:predicted metal-dependent HD superfamily phosphohydrolase